ncbi:hypothetical protein NL676_026554 [Syzygium grande]|nr:hypothetical protein NL676_026554 [Syzygium grande]
MRPRQLPAGPRVPEPPHPLPPHRAPGGAGGSGDWSGADIWRRRGFDGIGSRKSSRKQKRRERLLLLLLLLLELSKHKPKLG